MKTVLFLKNEKNQIIRETFMKSLSDQEALDHAHNLNCVIKCMFHLRT
jgi:hypothetical protein